MLKFRHFLSITLLRCIVFAFPICHGDQIFINEPVTVTDFVGSGLEGRVDGIGGQTMFEVTETKRYYLAKDGFQNIFLLNGTYGEKTIRKISKDGVVSTLASVVDIKTFVFSPSDLFVLFNGINESVSSTSDFKTFSIINFKNVPIAPQNLSGSCVDSSGNIYISDSWKNKIYRLKTSGQYEVFAGSGNKGSLDGNGIFSSFNLPTDLAVDSQGNIYVNDSGNWVIRVIDQSKNVKTLSGRPNTIQLFAYDGNKDNVDLRGVNGMGCDKYGNLIVACGTTVRIIDKNGYVKTVAGDQSNRGYLNGNGRNARFDSVTDVLCVGSDIFVAESAYPRIRRIQIGSSTPPKPVNSISLKLSAGITINGFVGKKYSVESSSNGGVQWSAVAEIELPKTPYTWFDESAMGTNKIYRVFELP